LRRGRRGGPRVEQLNDELAGNRDSTPDKVETPAAPVSTPGVETTIPHDRVA